MPHTPWRVSPAPLTPPAPPPAPLQLVGFMQWFVRQTAEVENYMTSVERMLEYTQLPQVRAGGGGARLTRGP